MIERAEHNDNFVQVKNETVRDDRLSFEARGFLFYMLSLSDSWDFSIEGLAYQTGLSTKVVMRLIGELKACGYIRQVWKKDKAGRFSGYDWTVSELPKNGTTAKRESRKTEVPTNGTPETRNSRSTGLPQTGTLKNTNNIENKYKEDKPKEVYGEFENVLLTAEEFKKLGDQYGDFQRDIVLEELSGYIRNHPNKYKDHYLTLRNWLLRKKSEVAQPKQPQKPDRFDLSRLYAIADKVKD